jgi:hypothetical protein
MKLVKVSSWDKGNKGVYQLHYNNIVIPFEFQKKIDKKRTLYCVECSLTGYFEEYGLNNVKTKIINKINLVD